MTKSFPSIMLIGMAGVGKSTVGRLLARNLGYRFIDVDKRLSEKTHLPLGELISKVGESEFLRMEAQTIQAIDYDHVVVAPGGSVAYHADVIESIRGMCRIVFLKDDIVSIRRRVPNIESRGIVGMGDMGFEALYNQRQPMYEKMADVIISIQGRSVTQIVRQIIGLVK